MLSSNNYGILLGFLKAYKISYQEIDPKCWQSAMLNDADGSDSKARSMVAARALFPGVPIKRHDQADALLIAKFTEGLHHD